MRFDDFEKICRNAIDDLTVPSIVAAIGDKNGVYYKKAFGYSRVIMNDFTPDGVFAGPIPDNAVKATADTLYDMASLSKLIGTTMVALKLIEAGVITLSDTVGTYFEDAPEDKKDITVRQLMTHSSGISAHFSLEAEAADNGRESVVKAVLDHPLKYKADTAVEYSCMGYILLCGIIERATGQTLDVLAKKLVFDPLKMYHTGYHPGKSADIAATEWNAKLGRYIQGEVHDENARFCGGVSGNAGIFSCIDDLCNFAGMLSAKGAFRDKRYLSEPTFERAITNYTPYGKESRGLGFQLTEVGVSAAGDLFAPLSYGHTGFTGTSLYVDRDTGMYLILLTNRVHYTRQNTRLFRLRRVLHNTALAAYTTQIKKG